MRVDVFLKNEQNETYPIDEPGIYLLTISSDDALEVTKLSKVEAVNTKCVGSFQEKPLNSAIGFSYFCTDRKTTESSTTRHYDLSQRKQYLGRCVRARD